MYNIALKSLGPLNKDFPLITSPLHNPLSLYTGCYSLFNLDSRCLNNTIMNHRFIVLIKKIREHVILKSLGHTLIVIFSPVLILQFVY